VATAPFGLGTSIYHTCGSKRQKNTTKQNKTKKPFKAFCVVLPQILNPAKACFNKVLSGSQSWRLSETTEGKRMVSLVQSVSKLNQLLFTAGTTPRKWKT